MVLFFSFLHKLFTQHFIFLFVVLQNTSRCLIRLDQHHLRSTPLSLGEGLVSKLPHVSSRSCFFLLIPKLRNTLNLSSRYFLFNSYLHHLTPALSFELNKVNTLCE